MSEREANMLTAAGPEGGPGAKRADLVMLPIDQIDATHNLRTEMHEGFLAELGESISELGMLQPIVARKMPAGSKWAFRLIAGHQRLEAAKRAGETFVEAKLYASVDDAWEARARLAENVQRRDLNHAEVAAVFGQATEAGMSVAQIAHQANISEDTVRRHLSLTRLAEPVMKLAASGRLPVHQAELIARVGDVKRQIDLAGAATNLRWGGEKTGWVEVKYWGHAAGDPRDYVMSMAELRKQVAWAMCGLAACGWLKHEVETGEPFKAAAGRGRCEGCPDNTASYADQPMLFAGIRPQGSDKKGYCTNRPCYEAKSKAWEKVKAAKHKADKKKRTAAAAKAKKAGLDVCQSCGRIADAVSGYTSTDSGAICPACVEKVKKGRGKKSTGNAGQSKIRQSEIEKAQAAFPRNAAEKLAVAMWEYFQAVDEAIAAYLEGFAAGAPKRMVETIIARYVGFEGSPSHWSRTRDELLEMRIALAEGKTEIGGKILAELWRESACVMMEAPGIDYRGGAENVPLDADTMAEVDAAEAIATAWGVDIPPRPKKEDFAEEPAEKKPEPGKKGKKAKAAKKAMGAGSGDDAGGETDGQKAANHLRNRIVQGRKADALAAIAECEDRDALLACQALGLRGDWRRAAVSKRIDELAKAVAK